MTEKFTSMIESAPLRSPGGALCRRIAPEDVLPGMFITIAVEHRECVNTWQLEWHAGSSPPFLRWSEIPRDAGKPLRVVGVCLPFVLVQKPSGRTKTLDLRRVELFALTDRFGREAFVRMAQHNDAHRSDRGAGDPCEGDP